MMKENLNRLIASILVAAQIALYVPAQTYYDAGRQQGRARLEQYLNLAQQEVQDRRWEELSARGLEAALTEWESMTVYERENRRDEWERERKNAETEFRLVQDARYSEWFCDRFFEQSAQIKRTPLALDLAERAATWLYDDGTGGTRFVAVDDAEFAAGQWKQEVAGAVVDRYMAEWEKNHAALFTEIRGRLREKGIDESLASLILEDREANYRAYVRAELHQVAAREENALMRVLLYDKDSLQRMSEAEAAHIIAEEAAQSARSKTDADMDALFKTLETKIADEDVDNISLTDMNAWLDQFRRAFEKGLAQWEGAEGRFLVARAEWEQNAQEVYLDSEQEWTKAYKDLQEKRTAWTREINERVKEGQRKWAAERNQLDAMLEQASKEFTTAAARERDQVQKNLAAHLALYTQSRQMIAMAVEGADIWFDHYGEKYNGKYSVWKTDDIAAWRGSAAELSELIYWQNIHKTYDQTAQGALQKLYTISNGVFTLDGPWAYLDELQVELLKAKTVAAYWQREVEVAKAVNDYSAKVTSDKEISSETLAGLNAAQSAYNQSLINYNAQIAALDEAGKTIDDKSADLNGEMRKLKDLQADLADKQREYRALAELLKGVDDAFLKQQILVLVESRNTPSLPKGEYFDAAQAYAQAVQENMVNEVIAYLVNRGGMDDISLTDALAEQRRAETYGDANTGLTAEAFSSQKIAVLRLSDLIPQRAALEAEAAVLESETSTGEDRLAATLAWRNLWRDVGQYWADQIRQREGAVLYLLTGVTGYEEDIDTTIHEAIVSTYKTYAYGDVNRAHREALSALKEKIADTDLDALISASITAFDTGGTAALTGVTDYLEELSFIGAGAEIDTGLNTAGQFILANYQQEVLELFALHILHAGTSAQQNARIALVTGDYTAMSAWEEALIQYTLEEQKHNTVDWRSDLAGFIDFDAKASDKQAAAFKVLVSRDALALVSAEVKVRLAETASWFASPQEDLLATGAEEASVGASLKALQDAEEVLQTETLIRKNTDITISDLIFSLKNNSLSKGALKSKISAAELVLKQAQVAYDAVRMGTYQQAITALETASDSYNTALLAANAGFALTEAAKLELRKKQGVYDWAAGIYLEDLGANADRGFITPKEKLFASEYSASRADIALQVLENVMGKRENRDSIYNETFALYAESVRVYYLGRAAVAAAGEEIARQKNIVRTAEYAELVALAKLVQYHAPKDEETGRVLVKKTHLDMIRLVKTGDTYRVRLTGASQEMQDRDAIDSYFGDETLDFPLVDNEKNKKTQAEADTLEWLQRVMAGGEDYLGNLGLAFMYLQMTGARTGKGAWILEGDRNPDSDAKWNLGNVPMQNMHNFAVGGNYQSYRRQALSEAYQGVMNRQGGSEDLAKYILYRDTMLSSDLNLQQREKSVLETRAMDKLLGSLGQYISVYTRLGAISAGIAAGLFVTAGFLWFIPPAAAALAAMAVVQTVIAVHEFIKARDLNVLWNSINTLKQGGQYILRLKNSEDANSFSAWRAAHTDMVKKQNKLKECLGATPEGTKMTYGKFTAALNATWNAAMEVGTVRVGKEEALAAYSQGAFDAANGQNAQDSLSVMDMINTYLGQQENLASGVVDVRAGELQAGQALEKSAFYTALNASFAPSDEAAAELRHLALKAADIRLSAQERRAAETAYDSIASVYTSSTAASTLRTDLEKHAASAFGSASWSERAHDSSLVAARNNLWDTRSNREHSAEVYVEDNFAMGLDALMAAYDHAQAAQFQLKIQEWVMVQQGFEMQENRWWQQIDFIAGKAAAEWEKALGVLAAGRNTWQETFENTWQEKQNAWFQSYVGFLEDKDRWMLEQYLYAANFKAGQLLADSGADVTAAITASLEIALAGSQKSNDELVFQSAHYVDDLLGQTNLAGITSYTDNLMRRIDGSSGTVRRGVQQNGANGKATASAILILGQLSQDRRDANSKIAAAAARQHLDIIRNSYKGRLAAENTAITSWETRLVLEYGYTVGAEISRRQVVNSTLIENVFETQKVYKYVDFVTGEIPLGTSLDDSSLSGLDADVVMQKLARAQNEYEKWSEEIFGKAEGDSIKQLTFRRDFVAADGTSVKRLHVLEGKDYDTMSDGEKNEYRYLNATYATMRDGKLGAHIGYGPAFKDEIDPTKGRSEAVLSAGSGEMGKILLDFQWNSLRAGLGFSRLAAPSYDKPIWDDTGSPFKAPSLRGVLDIAVSIVATFLPPGVSSVVGMMDDFLFAGLDMSGGYKTTGEVGKELGRKILTQMITSRTAGVGTNIKNTAGRIITRTAVSAATTWVTTAFIDAVDFGALFRGDFGAVVDWEKVGQNTRDGIGAIITSGLVSGLGAWNNYDSNGFTLNGRVFKAEDIQAFNGLVGGLAGGGINYAVNGNFSLNLANFRGVGFLELDFTRDGVTGTIGRGGVDVSLGTLQSAFSGAKETAQLFEWKYHTNDAGQRDMVGNLNAINQMGWASPNDSDGLQLAQDLWEGRADIEYAAMEEGTWGKHYLNSEGKRVIVLDEKLLDREGGAIKGIEQAAQIASLLSHENAHLMGADESGPSGAYAIGYAMFNTIAQLFGVTGEGYENKTGIAAMSAAYFVSGAEAVLKLLEKYGALAPGHEGEYFMPVAGTGYLQDVEDLMKTIPLGNGKTQAEVNTHNAGLTENALQAAWIENTANRDPETPPVDFQVFKDSLTVEDRNTLVQDYNTTNNISFAQYVSMGSAGCVLTTAVNTVFTLTGRRLTLTQANDFLSGRTDIDGNVNPDGPGRSYFVSLGEQYGETGLLFEDAVNAMAGFEAITAVGRYSGAGGEFAMRFAQQATFQAYLAKVVVDNVYHHVLGADYDFGAKTMAVVDTLNRRREYNKGYDIKSNTRFDLYRVTPAALMVHAHAWG